MSGISSIATATSVPALSAPDALARARYMAQGTAELIAQHRDDGPSFAERLRASIDNVAQAQADASQLRRDFEVGNENDLTKVMVAQQVSSLSFQLTLNVRNKALSAYKDIMNMPV